MCGAFAFIMHRPSGRCRNPRARPRLCADACMINVSEKAPAFVEWLSLTEAGSHFVGPCTTRCFATRAWATRTAVPAQNLGKMRYG